VTFGSPRGLILLHDETICILTLDPVNDAYFSASTSRNQDDAPPLFMQQRKILEAALAKTSLTIMILVAQCPLLRPPFRAGEARRKSQSGDLVVADDNDATIRTQWELDLIWMINRLVISCEFKLSLPVAMECSLCIGKLAIYSRLSGCETHLWRVNCREWWTLH